MDSYNIDKYVQNVNNYYSDRYYFVIYSVIV
jgi:hypothetical protein